MNGKTATTLIGVVIGMVLMFMLNIYFGDKEEENIVQKLEDKKPLYWVAPMDPNFKRDKPGQSPMGMDLIPVYDNDGGNESDPGTIKISPNVINNLGVKMTEAKISTLNTEINTVGYIQFDEDQIAHIHPRVEGWIEKLYIKSTGNPVVQGQALYEIYSPSLVNAQEELILALKRGNNTLIKASKERLRSLQLPESAIKLVENNKKIQQNITFYAPQSGVVDKLMIRQGMFVKPGTSIMSIAKLDFVWVEAEIFERQASMVQVGQSVSMSTDFIPTKTWKGLVDYIYPTLDPKTRTLKLRLRFENSNNLLKPNMFSQVTIHPNSHEKALLVPRQAVIRTGDFDRIVLSKGDGQFKSIKVKLGRMDDEYIEILQGLQEGEELVYSAQFLLDSESSKTSDFIRMSHTEVPKQTATVNGNINSINIDNGMLNIDRDPIEKWNRPAATVNFMTDNYLDLSLLVVGMKVKFTFYIDDGQFVITEISEVNY